MAHDVFISYSSRNKELADTVYENLENNGIKCWIDSKDIETSTYYADKIVDGLNVAKVVVLVFSKDSYESKYVNEEIGAAFETNKRIVPFKIDETLPEGDMKFYLKNTQWLDASPETREKEGKTLQNCYDQLVSTVKKILKNWDLDGQCGECHRMFKISDEFTSEKSYKIYKSSRICQKCQDKGILPPDPPGFFQRYKLPIIAVIVIVLIAISGFVAFNAMNSQSNNDSNETGISIGYVGLDDYGDNNYVYSVFGTVSPDSSNSSGDVVHVNFYDGSGKVVGSSDTKIGDIEGNTLGSIDTDNNNTVKVSVELKDKDGKVLFSEESDNILKQ